jgi:propionate catabolism operon transcriptional regulator
VLLLDEDTLQPAHLPAALVAAALNAPAVPAPNAPGTRVAIPTLEDVELPHIRRVLQLCGGNRTVAAQHLGITRQTLTKRLGGAGDDAA